MCQAGCELDCKQIAYGFRYTVASLYAYEENARPLALERVKISGKVSF